jgi:hypothetical protein
MKSQSQVPLVFAIIFSAGVAVGLGVGALRQHPQALRCLPGSRGSICLIPNGTR